MVYWKCLTKRHNKPKTEVHTSPLYLQFRTFGYGVGFWILHRNIQGDVRLRRVGSYRMLHLSLGFKAYGLGNPKP